MQQPKGLPNIETSKKVINAYDLYKILENEIFGLESELNQLLTSMHTYCKYNKSLLTKIFNSKREEGIIPACNGIKFENKNHKMIISLYLLSNPNRLCSPELKIIYYPKKNKFEVLGLPKRYIGYYYDYDYQRLTNKEDLECIEAHLEQIKNICLSSVYGKSTQWQEQKINRIINYLKIENEVYEVTFSYNHHPKKLTPIIHDKNIDNELIIEDDLILEKTSGLIIGEYHQMLSDIFQNKEAILREIPVWIPSLSQEVQDLINHQRYKLKEQTLEPTKTKSSIRKLKIKK